MGKVNEDCLKQIFYDARTHYKWHDKHVTDELLHDIYNIMRLGPTSANCSPLRILFLKSENAKERLRPHLDPGNLVKTMKAPVTALFACFMRIYPIYFLLPMRNHGLKASIGLLKKQLFVMAVCKGLTSSLRLVLVVLIVGLCQDFPRKGWTKNFFLKDVLNQIFYVILDTEILKVFLGHVRRVFPLTKLVKFFRFYQCFLNFCLNEMTSFLRKNFEKS